MLNFNFLLETGADTAGKGGSTGIWIYLVMFAALGVFFFFSFRSRKKQEKEESRMRDELQVGDEVTTIGGIIGKVISIKGETFVLETTKERTQIRFLKGAIRNVDVRVADVAKSVAKKKAEQEEAENASENEAK